MQIAIPQSGEKRIRNPEKNVYKSKPDPQTRLNKRGKFSKVAAKSKSSCPPKRKNMNVAAVKTKLLKN
jgi:hypothetical protein